MAKPETYGHSFTREDVAGKRVLVRVDINVPYKNGTILDETRVRAIVPTLLDLKEKQAKVIILAHLGRPDGGEDALQSDRDQYSLNLLVPILTKLLKSNITFMDNCIGEDVVKASHLVPEGGFLLLENLRFHKGETENDDGFSEALAQNGDVYVNDAFAVCHRRHASIVGLPSRLPHFYGFNLQNEIRNLQQVHGTKSQPILSVVGGAKVSTKMGLLKKLIEKSRFLVVGGGIANTFLKIYNIPLGNSLVEPECVDEARFLLDHAKKHGCEIVVPRDVRVARDLGPSSEVNSVSVYNIHPSESIFDIGPQTVSDICERMERARTLVWNGPVGLFEHKPFDRSSIQIAQCASYLSTNGRLISIAGGGETLACIREARASQDFTYLSTGGGAFLAFLEGKTLPGIEALKQPNS